MSATVHSLAETPSLFPPAAVRKREAPKPLKPHLRSQLQPQLGSKPEDLSLDFRLLPLESAPFVFYPIVALIHLLLNCVSMGAVRFGRQGPPSAPSSHPQIQMPPFEMLFLHTYNHSQHVHCNIQANEIRCANLLKLESLSTHVAHLRSLVDAERTARTSISAVHAKTQIVVEEQRDEIARLEGVVESLRDEVERLTARLVEALSKQSHRVDSGFASRAICDYDKNFGVPVPPRTQSQSPPTLRKPILLCTDDEDSDADTDSDSDNNADEDSEEEWDQDDDDFLATHTSDPIAPLDHLVTSILATQPTTPPTPPTPIPIIKTPEELHNLATANLLQSLRANASPSSVPTLLDSLATTLPLTPPQRAKTALISLLQSLPVAALASAQSLAAAARTTFETHLGLLQIHMTGCGAVARRAALRSLAGHAKNVGGVWRAGMGMVVYVLVDMEVVEARDVVSWWREEGGVGEDVFLDRLVQTLERYCGEDHESEDEDEAKDDDGSVKDADCGGSCCGGSEGDETIVADVLGYRESTLAEGNGSIGKERRVSFNI